MSVLRFVVVAVLFIALLFVSLDNAELVTLRFFRVYSLEAPLIFVVLCAFALGAALGLTAGALRTAGVRRELRRVRREAAHGAHAGPATAVREASPRPPLDAL